MSEPEVDAAEASEDLPAKSGGKKKLLVIGGAAGAVVILAIVALSMMGSGGEEPGKEQSAAGLEELTGIAPKKPGEEGGEGAKKPKKDEVELPEDTFMFDPPFFVMLADPNVRRPVQFRLLLELTHPEIKHELTSRQARYRHAIIGEVSSRLRADLAPAAGRNRLKRDLTRLLEGLLEEPDAIKAIYFSDFILP